MKLRDRHNQVAQRPAAAVSVGDNLNDPGETLQVEQTPVPVAKQVEQTPVPVAKGPSPADIGKNGTLAEFLDAWQRAKEKKIEVYSGGRMSKVEGDPQDEISLREGAMEGFLEGNVENLQTILADPDKFGIDNHYHNIVDTIKEMERLAKERISSKTKSTTGMLRQIVQRSEGIEPSKLINLALAKVPEESRQNVLDCVLNCAVLDCTGDIQLIDGILKAGANPNAERDGFKGYILGNAVTKGQPQEVVELLLENGASFAETAFTMRAEKGWDENAVDKLRLYRDKVTYETDSWESKEAARELLKEMQARMETLMEFGLPAQKPAAAAPKRRASPKAPLAPTN